MAEVINMCKCPYCDEQWVREDDELVCDKCRPKLDADLAIGGIITSLDELSKLSSSVLKDRTDLLVSAHHKFTQLIKKVNPKPKKK